MRITTPSTGTPLLGCIADDFTGAADLAGMLVRAGMRTVQLIGVPDASTADGLTHQVDAVVIALKSRTTPAAHAVRDSLAALQWLQRAGCQQFLFKYCSTFDSTAHGNIGPVLDALMQALQTDFTIACPAFPENKRTIFNGHLFVGAALLNESGMQHHPLTPMTDANLVRVLQQQTTQPVGLIGHAVVAGGAAAISAEIERLKQQGIALAIVDAITNADLFQIGAACTDLPLLSGGSGIALGLPQNFRQHGQLADGTAADRLPAVVGYRAIICGSCSLATQAQVADWINADRPAFMIDPIRLASGEDLVQQAITWATPLLAHGPVLVYATANAVQVAEVQSSLGAEQAGALVEQALATIAKQLVEQGVTQLLVAGGETSGAVVSALGIQGLRIGPQIDPGVPWTVSLGTRPLALALKSGNFGSTDFFSKAWQFLPHESEPA
jgi:uncharacterized protein YgbK (DUF1537 family)